MIWHYSRGCCISMVESEKGWHVLCKWNQAIAFWQKVNCFKYIFYVMPPFQNGHFLATDWLIWCLIQRETICCRGFYLLQRLSSAANVKAMMMVEEDAWMLIEKGILKMFRNLSSPSSSSNRCSHTHKIQAKC